MDETSPSSSWRRWPKWGDERTTPQIEEEIAEELQLHFDLMVEEEERNGATPDEAKWRATEKFGNRDSIAAKCKQIQTWERVMLQRIQVGLVTLLIVVMGFSYLESMSLSSQLASIENQLNDFKNSLITPLGNDNVTGKEEYLDDETMEIFVCDENDQPIPNAFVIVWWCDLGRDNFDFYRRKTSDNGKIIILRDETAILNSVIGYSQGRTYTCLTLSQSRQDYLQQQKLVLRSTVKQNLLLHDDEGIPLSDASVYMMSRDNPQDLNSYYAGRNYYSQNPPQGPTAKTDSEGNVSIDWFALGDKAQLWAVDNEKGTYQVDFEVQNATNSPISLELERKPPKPFQGGGQF